MGIIKIIPGKGIMSHMIQKMVYVLKGFVTYLISCMNQQDRIWSAWISKPEKNFGRITLPKFNVAPEKWWLEDYYPFRMVYAVYFQGLC